jgi:3-hydroxyisobutyrate dehydrogenase-like beta-hydroxyacid dehydrogenase
LPKYKKKYLFLGLGTMGFHMAGNLSMSKQIDLYIFNRTKTTSMEWLNLYKGYLFNENNRSIKFDGIIACLKDDFSILELLIKKNFLGSLKRNGFILDHTTTSLELVRTINTNQTVIKKGLKFFDAPVSGGEIGAINGTLSIMYGGPHIIKKNSKLFNAMSLYGSHINYIGPSGHGQIAKMINQISIIGILQGLAEAINFGKTLDVNMVEIFNSLTKGAAQSWQMDNRFHTMIGNDFKFGFAIDLMIKDLKIALAHAKKNKINLSYTKKILNDYNKLNKLGLGKLDTSALIKKYDL